MEQYVLDEHPEHPTSDIACCDMDNLPSNIKYIYQQNGWEIQINATDYFFRDKWITSCF